MKIRFLSPANEYKRDDFAKWKKELFAFVADTFEIAESDDTNRGERFSDDPIKSFLQIADSRTRELAEVDVDCSQDFYDWKNREGRWADKWDSTLGHKFEIAGRIRFYPVYTDGLNGYFEWGAFIWSHFRVAEFCKEPNVMLSSREWLPDIIHEKDTLRVEPGIVMRAYGYPNKDYSEPVAYDEGLNLKQKRRVKWDPLVESQVKQ